jgi:hypothetical protein
MRHQAGDRGPRPALERDGVKPNPGQRDGAGLNKAVPGKEENAMVGVGDRIVVDARKVGQERRRGVVEAVNGAMILVRWDTGGTSTLFPTAGSLSVESAGETRSR